MTTRRSGRIHKAASFDPIILLRIRRTSHGCWEREHKGLGIERDAVEKKRSKRIVKVQKESMADVAMTAEVEAKVLDERTRGK
ncbi:Protein kinase domain-containing protein [Psidium guajava]|nr:Protein kinase domain-containing protein [Psidium guajava]